MSWARIAVLILATFSTRVPAYLDVGFRFELVEGQGRVRLDAAGD